MIGNHRRHHNTAIIYVSDSRNEHHANLSITGRSICYPDYGKEGHKTIGIWSTTWRNAFGNLDLKLQKNGIAQSGALAESMAYRIAARPKFDRNQGAPASAFDHRIALPSFTYWRYSNSEFPMAASRHGAAI